VLIIARPDGEFVKVRRHGVFAIERDRAEAPGHLAKAVEYAKKRMIFGLAQKGYEYVDEADGPGTGWEVRGPLAHTEFSDSDRPDPGPAVPPPNLDPDRLAEWSRQERERTALKFDIAGKELVDYELVASFLRRHQPEAVFI
jgi:hypothetical protein